MSQESSALGPFGGTVRLFPLPNLVLFPNVTQPLHIFEPRYRAMMSDALEDDRLLAMALLCPGWEEEYHRRPPIHPMVCIGRIQYEEQLADGCYNLMLEGLTRARIVEELKTPHPYRVARVELAPEVGVESPEREAALRQILGQEATPYFARHPAALEQLTELLQGELGAGALCDILAYALPLGLETKQSLLGEPRVEQRIQALLTALRGATSPEQPRRRFPPEFSGN